MRLLMILAYLTLMTSGTGLAAQPAACVDQTPCQIGERSYHVREPDDWDGVTPMPVLLHFHGWKRQGTLTVRHSRIAGATRTRGVLLLGPNGLGGSWNFRNGPSGDVAFARAVIEDAARRYPIDRKQIYISGYSFGSAMAWRFVCEDGADVRALLAVAGTLRQDEDCATAPAIVRHVHGLSDRVMDFPMGPGGDTLYPVSLWRDRLACAGPGAAAGDWSVTPGDTFSRTTWTACSQGAEVTLDLHPRGHFIPVGWIARQLDELLSPPS